MQIPDSTICSLLNQGEEKGMEYLFTRYYKPLVLWAASFLNNIPQSEDLVQDFFIRLWKKRTQTSLQATTFKSFLYTSVRNLCSAYTIWNTEYNRSAGCNRAIFKRA